MKIEGVIFLKNKVKMKLFSVIDKDEVVSFQLDDFALVIRKSDLRKICENVED